jgi:hypothetical protein
VLSPLQSSSPAAPPRLGRFLAGAVAEDRGGDRGRGEPQRCSIAWNAGKGGGAGAGRGDLRGGGVRGRRAQGAARAAGAVGAPDGDRRDGARGAQLRRHDGGPEAAAEPRVGRVRGHARRARRRVLLLLAPEAALLHLQIVDSSLTELDYWGLEKLKAILTSCWIWRRHSTQEHMD